MIVNRRDFIQTAGAASAAAVTGTATVAASSNFALGADPKGTGANPNILIVVCDQMNLDAISAYQRFFDHNAWLTHWVDTPNLDDLVHNGVSFTESHSTNPVCCPSRSSLFTGRYSLETGVVVNNVGIDQSVLNMGQWFEQNSNYRRAYCGKWHAGGPWNNPDVRGPRKIPGFDTIPNGPGSWGRHMDYGISTGIEAYVRNHQGNQPFLAVAGFMDPHDICFWSPRLNNGRTRYADFFDLGDQLPELPPNVNFDFSEIWEDPVGYSEMQWKNYIYDYCRMVERLDRNVGRILRAVRDRGDDTILLFTSDHGDGVGRHGRVGKPHPYDETMKVPFIVYGPNFGIQRNVIDTEHLVSGVDIMSTVCDYAGIESPPNSRGMSLRPLLEGTPAEWRESLFAELHQGGRVIRSDRYKYVMSYEGVPENDRKAVNENYLTTDGTATRFLPEDTSRLKRVEQAMLFDMKNDPWESRNLIDDPKYRPVIDQHESLLANFETAMIPGTEFTRK